MNRRDFLRQLGLAGLAAMAGGGVMADDKPAGPLARRPYGETGLQLSIVGFGGIVVMKSEQSEANDAVAWAVDRGVNYFDVAPSYGDAQDRLGPALKPYRDSVFLACKTGKRDAAGAREELENSLRVLQTDHFDLYQMHGLVKPEEVDKVFGPGGAMETFVAAREAGKVRYLGFSAHDMQSALLALSKFHFDSLLFPFNAVCMENGGFGQQVLDEAKRLGTARLGLKAIAWTKVQPNTERKYPKCWYQPQDSPEQADLLLRYALDLPITATVPPGDVRLMKLCVELASRYQPLSDADRARLKQQIAGLEPIFKHA
ncbi:MAG: aldo/keto reductase [Armatimonadia bacterium]